MLWRLRRGRRRLRRLRLRGCTLRMQGNRSTQKQCEKHLDEAAKSSTGVRATHDNPMMRESRFAFPCSRQHTPSRLAWDGDDEPGAMSLARSGCPWITSRAGSSRRPFSRAATARKTPRPYYATYCAAACTAPRGRKCGITSSPTMRYCSTILSFGVVSGGDRLMCCIPG